MSRPTRDLLGEPVHYSEREIFFDAVRELLMLLVFIAVAAAWLLILVD